METGSPEELSDLEDVDFATSHMGRTMHHSVDGPINTISINKDATNVVVAGRNVFKVFSIDDDEFVERHNFRVGKNLNLSYSALDVAWNPVEEHTIASAATNGAVVVWNLNRASRSKQEIVFAEHKRTVNKVVFHATELQWLLSGSQDGYMKLFDIRKKESATTFSGPQPESVRDVQFSPHHYFKFAAAYENGNVQIWDIRRPDRWERQFPAHSGPVFTIDWHPEDNYWIASAGRDKTIKVWDLSQPQRPRCTHTVQTIASVARIKWRPQRRYHIASCALLVDFNINIWDIRRPFIPFAAFNEHKDVTTGIVWRHDPHIFLSGSKDNTLYQHMFRDATRPADQANPVGIAMNNYGFIGHACSDKLIGHGGAKGSSSNYSSTKLPSFFRKVPDRSEQFTVVSSTLFMFEHRHDEDFSMNWLIESAKRYQLTGKSLEGLCDHNAAVAESLGRHQIAQTWRMLKLLYCTKLSSPATNRTMSVLTTAGDKGNDNDREKRNLDVSRQDSKTTELDSKDKHGVDTSGVSDSSDDDETDLTNIASGLAHQQGDFFFGDGEGADNPFGYDNLTGMELSEGPGLVMDWNLPTEAFQPRHEIVAQSVSPQHTADRLGDRDSPSSANESDFSSHVNMEENAFPRSELINARPFVTQMPVWQCTDIVVEMLYHYAKQGDVQMAVSVIIILGDKIRPHIEEQALEQWFMSYIDLLSRFELYCVAAEVIKSSDHPSVSSLNQQSTSFHTNCDKCGKPLIKAGWTCDRCKKMTNLCSICHHPVKGLYVWCQGCSHGGHLNHIQDWLSKSPYCPTGCGHMCEYT
ncbi:GATOR2 complex protein WDR24-like isoform X2 [Lineus longissimus]|uniref:GATOR2 complex protein WDR24-like isoform X2 n=1 Tax=Lineus longissimus TaxID=88925 RepID=UPI00315CDC46